MFYYHVMQAAKRRMFGFESKVSTQLPALLIENPPPDALTCQHIDDPSDLAICG